MSYQVLARKWRPRSFQEMVGQEHILRMLINALNDQRLHHAYLFTGTRGVGKTTVARIFAKCLNCETGVTAQPCETCQTCQAINAGKFLDLIEVDAASRTRVEDTRELLDNVQYPPVQGRYKVYLIDEVHMLSGHSFNALLKTLEEPPAYVKFLLATTDPKRLPITILSRCLQFNLNPVQIDKIANHLQHICTTEHIPFDAAALRLVAKGAHGSMRDALSLLDQTIAFCHNNITLTDTQAMLGTIEQDAIFRLLDALANHDGKQLLTEITKIAEYGPDFDQLLEDLLSILHHISLIQIVPDAPDVMENIKAFAKRFSNEDVQLYYQIALLGRRVLSVAATPHQGFEMVMLRMLAFHPMTQPKQKINSPEPIAVPENNTQKNSAQNWPDILANLQLSGMAQALASHCVLSHLSDNKIELCLAAKHESLLNKNLVERIEQALSRYLNKPMKLEIKTSETELRTPAKQQQEKQEERQADATATIQNNTDVQKMIDLFDATLDIRSIKAT